jgi:hypothetical protein
MLTTLFIVLWTALIIIEFFIFKKGVEMAKLVIPCLFTLSAVLIDLGTLNLVFYSYVALSWIVYFVHLLRKKNI